MQIAVLTYPILIAALLCGAENVQAKPGKATDKVANKAAMAKCPNIYVLDAPKKHPHSTKVLQLLEAEFKEAGVKCKVTLAPVYTSKGDLTEKLVNKAALRIHRYGATAKKPLIVHLSFNLPSNEKTKSLEEILKRLSKPGIFLVGPVGENSDDANQPLKLSETVLGQIPRIVLVGELTAEGNLAPRSNYGPEMMTALSPKDGLSGSSFSAPILTARAALKLLKSTPEKLFKDLKKAKALANQSLYPNLKELGLD